MVLWKPEIVKSWAGKDQNVYRREVLYQEIWNFPITEVAKKYAVSEARASSVPVAAIPAYPWVPVPALLLQVRSAGL